MSQPPRPGGDGDPGGRVLAGRFEIIGELGRGGMATVYLARDRVRGERVALKVLHAHLAQDPGMQARLRTELHAAERIHHPGALVPHELHSLEDGGLALSLPYHSGRTLAEVVRSEGPLSVDQVRRLGARLAEVLAAAHRAGVVHRDLTPANVMLDERGSPVLTDFGLARVQDAGPRRSTGLFGTTGYVAPEVFEGRRRDPRADLYGLGGVLCFALTGREPFEGAHAAGVLQKQLDGAHTPVCTEGSEVPAWLGEVVDRLLAPRPEDRPQGAAEVVEALQLGVSPQAAQSSGAAAEPVDAPSAPPESANPLDRLPEGRWMVSVRQGQEQRKRRLRARRRGQELEELPGLERRIRIEHDRRFRGSETRDPADVLKEELASLAGVAPEALPPSPAMELERFRLVEGVDQATAAVLAQRAQDLGFEARVFEGRPGAAALAISQVWWGLYPLLWTGWALSGTVGIPQAPVALPILLTIAWSIFVAPWADKVDAHGEALEDPLAFPGRARASAAAASGATASPAAVPSPPAVADSPEDALTQGAAGQGAGPETPAQRMTSRARRELAALEEAVQARAEELPEPVLQDLSHQQRALAEAVEALSPQVTALEGELARVESETGEDLGWMEARLRRLETLEAAGEAVDASERARLEAALAAHERALDAAGRLESELTAGLAALLELSAAAARARRELLGTEAPRVSAPRLADELEAQLRALAAARAEAAGQRQGS